MLTGVISEFTATKGWYLTTIPKATNLIEVRSTFGNFEASTMNELGEKAVAWFKTVLRSG